MQPGAPNLSMGVIFCGNHTLKCCLTAIRKFVQFRSSTSIRVLFTSNVLAWQEQVDVQCQATHCAEWCSCN